MRSASLSNDGKALGGKSVLVTAKGILNRLPSWLIATLPVDAVGAAALAIRVSGLGAATGGAATGGVAAGGAEITGCLMGEGATTRGAVGAGGAFTSFGAARVLGGAIAGFGSAGGGATGAGAFRIAANFGADGGLGRFTAGAFGAAGTREAKFSGSVNFDFGTAAGRTPSVLARRMGFSTSVGCFSRVIEAGAGGVTAWVGAKTGGTVGRLATPRDWKGFRGAADVAVFGRFNVERGIWRGGFAK